VFRDTAPTRAVPHDGSSMHDSTALFQKAPKRFPRKNRKGCRRELLEDAKLMCGLVLKLDEHFSEDFVANVFRTVRCRNDRISRTVRCDLVTFNSKAHRAAGFEFNRV
jgi:hypothetical protein